MCGGRGAARGLSVQQKADLPHHAGTERGIQWFALLRGGLTPKYTQSLRERQAWPHTCRQSSPTLKMAACQEIFWPRASCELPSSSEPERQRRPVCGGGGPLAQGWGPRTSPVHVPGRNPGRLGGCLCTVSWRLRSPSRHRGQQVEAWD